jgi:hypothetical protein
LRVSETVCSFSDLTAQSRYPTDAPHRPFGRLSPSLAWRAPAQSAGL